VTLPFFYFLQTHPEAERLISRMQEAGAAAEDGDSAQWNALINQVVRELRSSPAVEAARQEADLFLELARANIAGLPDSPYLAAMLELCDFVVQRTY